MGVGGCRCRETEAGAGHRAWKQMGSDLVVRRHAGPAASEVCFPLWKRLQQQLLLPLWVSVTQASDDGIPKTRDKVCVSQEKMATIPSSGFILPSNTRCTLIYKQYTYMKYINISYIFDILHWLN